MSRQTRNLLPFFLGIPMAAWVAWDLRGYGLPADSVLAVGLMAWACFSRAADLLISARTQTVHRCPDSRCSFSVRLSGVDAAESRRWQEVAHAHPHHRGV
ncbi:hypothetical protein [Streptomyces cacaoi]|uniref:hypothetical protein n=1 Tax=Streptomyces cacaoi TaxID=1898 RepID=UPI0033252216